MRVFLKENQLDRKIYELRQELIQIAGATGINSCDTINKSQELDQLVIFELKNRMRAAEIT